jgi:ribosomal protein S18 acetylase RimI-like enzyme
VRPVQLLEIDVLAALAETCHRDTRFYFDGHFSHAQCDALYGTWFRKSCAGYADATFILQDASGIAAGYVTCHLDSKHDVVQGRIGLVGVSETMRGRGFGSAMLRYALAWFIQQGCNSVSVVTQARNHAAQRLYQRLGFLTVNSQTWYHKWYGQSESHRVLH